ncbi:unnamed protein product, partial [Durusdinium trenchii]
MELFHLQAWPGAWCLASDRSRGGLHGSDESLGAVDETTRARGGRHERVRLGGGGSQQG